jgi:hypothetical protein
VTKSRIIRWVGKVACIGESRGVYRVLEGRPDGKRPLGRTRHTREDNIKINLEKVGWDVDWIDLAQDRDRWLIFRRSKLYFYSIWYHCNECTMC